MLSCVFFVLWLFMFFVFFFVFFCFFFFFFKQKTAYEMRISDWSSDVCSSDLPYLLSSNLPSVPARLAIDRLRRGLAVEDRVEFGAHLGQRIRLVARLCGVGNQIIKLIVARARL